MNRDIVVIDDDSDGDTVINPITTTTTNNTTNNRNTVGNGRVDHRHNVNNRVVTNTTPRNTIPVQRKGLKSDFLATIHEKRILNTLNQQKQQEQEKQRLNNNTSSNNINGNKNLIDISTINDKENVIKKSNVNENVNKSNSNNNDTAKNNNSNVNNSNSNNSNGVIKSSHQSIQDIGQSNSLRNQLEAIRKSKHSTYRGGNGSANKRMVTMNDIEKKSKYEQSSKMYFNSVDHSADKRSKVHTISNTFRDPESIGRKALELTNQFRKKQGKSELLWNQSIYSIAHEHSKNMGDGKVPFSHDGFDDRIKRFPFYHMRSGENVAMNNLDATVAEVAVNGWIDSPGHRENLLGDFTICTIGVYQNDKGMWYLTQLFAKT